MNLQSSWKEISKPTIDKSVPLKLHYLFTELQIFATHKRVYFIVSTVRKSNPTEMFTFINAYRRLSLAQGKIPALLLSFFQPKYSEYFVRIFTAYIFLVLIESTLHTLAAYMIKRGARWRSG